jgi:hypothetical protein
MKTTATLCIHSFTALLVGIPLALAPHVTQAQDLSLDNFKTGPGRIGPMTSGNKTASQTGAGIIGGTRTTELSFSGLNEFVQPASVQFRPSSKPGVPPAMVWSVGYKAYPRIDLTYGSSTTPLGLNLSGYDRLRVSFDGLQQLLNFNVTVFDSSYIAGSIGCNIYFINDSPLTVDFRFADISRGDGGQINWAAIEILDFVFQGGNLGSPNLAVTSIMAIPASDPPGTVTCNH